ncbi:hypothetical protein PVAP13_6KG217300 [Panicum virgatum]|uniref:Uncharacterized protein n=1 Tax=Panicum virgatum TaxID=38727 RepID=A0A8T0RCY2_PANVG|nr:hypothetical protein PVAP13_6KG217300 [Panicum virgatum]
MASAASTMHQKVVVAVCFMLILSFTGPSAMADILPNYCSSACDNACRLYGEAACWSSSGIVCPKVQECRDKLQNPCTTSCKQRCNGTPIVC